MTYKKWCINGCGKKVYYKGLKEGYFCIKCKKCIAKNRLEYDELWKNKEK
jgi:hypothetical protein